jgi:hypothetical protein
MLPQLNLKYHILSKFLIIIFLYFTLKVLFYSFVLFVDNDVALMKLSPSIQTFDLLLFGGMLFLFRTRVWPPFFSLGMNELNNNLGNANG